MFTNKLYLNIFIILLLFTIITISACSSSNSGNNEQTPAQSGSDINGEQILLNFATFWPGENFYVTEGHNAWANAIKQRVEAETPHSIEFQLHPGGALLGATEIFEGVANGAADIGSTCPSYTPGVFPATSAFELPIFMNDNAVVASKTIQEAYETMPIITNEYDDVKVMFFWATGPGDLLTTEPINSLDDLRGKEIRVAGGSVPAMEALGATPVTMPMGEAYLALDQGIVKGILGPGEILRGFRLAEVTGSITKTPFLYNIIFVKVMNMDKWNSLPTDVQKIIEEINSEFIDVYATLGKEQSILGQEYAIDNYGHDLITLSVAEEQRWIEALANVQSKWIDDMSKTGLPAQSIIEQALIIDQKNSGLYGN